MRTCLFVLALLLISTFARPVDAQTIWLSPQSGNTQPADYMDLFQPNAPWGRAASAVSVFETSLQWVLHGPEPDLRTMFANLRQRGLSLAVGMAAVRPAGGCGRGVEGYSDPNQPLREAQRIASLGGTAAFFDFDEPLFYGHVFAGDSRGHVRCQLSVEDIAHEAARRVAALRTVFPGARFGDIEPLMGFGPDWQATIAAWLDAYRQETGNNLAFFAVDLNWSADWQPRMERLAALLASRHVPLYVIYDGGGLDTSSEAWVTNAARHFSEMERETRIVPAAALIMSWNRFPTRVLPENDPGSLTNLALRYAHWRKSR